MPQVAEHRWFASGQAVQAEDAFTEDGDEVMYRSAGGDDEDDDNAPPPFERPEQAIPISRQRACLGDARRDPTSPRMIVTYVNVP